MTTMDAVVVATLCFLLLVVVAGLDMLARARGGGDAAWFRQHRAERD